MSQFFLRTCTHRRDTIRRQSMAFTGTRLVVAFALAIVVAGSGRSALAQRGKPAGPSQFEAVQERMAVHDHYRALDLLDGILKGNPKNAAAWFLRGTLLDEQIDFMSDKADADFRKAIELEPANAGFHRRLAEWLNARGRFTQAIDEYALAVRHDPKNIETLNGLGELGVFRELWPDTLNALASVEKSWPADDNKAGPTPATRARLIFFRALCRKGLNQPGVDEDAKAVSELDASIVSELTVRLALLHNRATRLKKRIEIDIAREDWALVADECEQLLKFWEAGPLKPKPILEVELVRINPPPEESLSYDIAHYQVERAKCLSALQLAGKGDLQPQIDSALAGAAAVVPVGKAGHEYQVAQFRENLQKWQPLPPAERFARARKFHEDTTTQQPADRERVWLEVRRALADDPKMAAAYRLRSRLVINVHGGLQRLQWSLAELDRAMSISPPVVDDYTWRADLYGRMAHRDLKNVDRQLLDLGLADLTKAIELAPKDVELRQWRAHVRKVENIATPQELLAEYNRILEIDPKSTDTYLERGSLYFKQEKFKEAAADLEVYLKAGTDNGYYRLMRGRALVSVNRVPEAREEFDKVVASGSQFAGEAKAQLEVIRNLAGQPGDVEGFVRRAQAHYLRKELASAIADYGKAIELKPADPALWFYRGVVEGEDRQFDKAVADLTKALELSPNSYTAYFQRGVVCLAQQAWAPAERDFDQALGLKRDYVEALTQRGVARMEQHKLLLARNDLNEADRLRKNDPAALANRAILALAMSVNLDQLGKARVELERAAELQPTSARVQLALAKVNYLYYSGRFQEHALKALDKALEADQRSVEAHILRGRALAYAGRNDEALAAFNRALELDPNATAARVFRIRTLMRMGRGAEGQAELDKTAPLGPKYKAWLDAEKAALEQRDDFMARGTVAPELYKRATNLSASGDFGAAADLLTLVLDYIATADRSTYVESRALSLLQAALKSYSRDELQRARGDFDRLVRGKDTVQDRRIRAYRGVALRLLGDPEASTELRYHDDQMKSRDPQTYERLAELIRRANEAAPRFATPAADVQRPKN